MLNQALTEIQSALNVLSEMAHSEQTVAAGAKNLETVTNKVNEAIAILQSVEHSLKFAYHLKMTATLERDKRIKGLTLPIIPLFTSCHLYR
jgi:hypothetical protein